MCQFPRKETMERISDRIKQARLGAGLTQQAVADAIGVYVTRYSQWERGVEPKADSLLKLASLFGVSLESLIPTRED